MHFKPHTQEQLKLLHIQVGKTYSIEYLNKDYFNGEETIERAKGVTIENDGNIYFNVVDPYGMDRLVMQVRILGS